MQLRGALPAAAYHQRTHERALPWPLAIVVICGLSVGLWVLLFRLASLLLRF